MPSKPTILNKAINKLLLDPLTQQISKTLSQEQKEFLKKIDSTIADVALGDDNARANATNIAMLNSRARPNIKDKPEGVLKPSVLRGFSVNYPIARACIDNIKNKITQLEWDITSVDDEDTNINEKAVAELKTFFKEPSGPGTDFRYLQENIMEDYLVMGTVALERGKTRGGNMLSLLPVDSGTMKLRLNGNGRTPQAPEIAYEQWIRGYKVAELTTEDMIIKLKNIRPNTPFGLGALESLVIQVQSALAGSVYNFKFFTDSNIAEGFVELPIEWSNDQVKTFQTHFDSMVAGDPRYQRKLKFMPGGIKYTPTKKPEDMSFERFELWLLRQTCAVFGVPPQDLGFTMDVNRATGEVQKEVGQERAKRPAVNFLQDLFTNIIQKDLGYPNLKFVYLNVDPSDLKTEAEIDDIRIRTGVVSVDEVRRREGLDEIGVSHFIMTGTGPMPVDQIGVIQEPEPKIEPKKEEKVDIDMERAEIKQWKTCAINDLKKEKPFRSFTSKFIDDEITEDIEKQLNEVNSREEINLVFDMYLKGDFEKIKKLRKISNELQKYL